MHPPPTLQPTLWQTLDAAADSAPEACALKTAQRAWSYRELALESLRASRWLADRGIQRGDRVASLAGNRAECLALLWALARLGAIWVPLNWRLAPPEWLRVLRDCSATLCLADASWMAAACELGGPWLPLGGWSGAPAVVARSDGTPGDALLIVYTSGTTGQPKGAVHTQSNVLANAQAAVRACGITPTDRVLTALPMFHVGGLCIHTVPALCVGATVVLHERFEPGAVLHSLAHEGISLLLQVPATLQALAQHADWASVAMPHLRAVWAGSSIVPPAAMAGFHARGIPVCNVYGGTETGPVSVVLGPQHAQALAGAVGWPAHGVELKLLNAATLSSGAMLGEVALRAPNVVSRYWPDRAALDADGFFHTGDLAERAGDGCLTIVGRSSELIISGGENIYPAEVEQALSEHPWVAQCAGIGLPDARWGEVVAAAVVLKTSAKADLDEISDVSSHLSEDSLPSMLSKIEHSILAHCKTRIARYKCPRVLRVMPSLPTTALGKVQKQLLKAQW